ncbi:NosD domain-containing protein [Puniceicoccus vermicola]|uniref:Right-handed parallel beta-helix repeat-containing protein n=1 Tax=Puniceicoccus vermicola TaxID=388746 RepID=A0A7X1AYC4_9BACT|nr:NosD domain-containing protein [Puniceicoccus vermicola]MBC2602147.1 right-handed parallel beta-helix repeat-containing protein [Puniceicoccus vermicola]
MRGFAGINILSFAIFLSAAAVSGEARELWVGQENVEHSSYSTIQEALNEAESGDLIRVAPGVYHERIVFRNGGAYGEPIILQGEPGAILDGSTPVEFEWEALPEVGEGVYGTPLGFFPFTVTAEGKTVTTLNEKRVQPDAKKHHFFDPIIWTEAFRDGVGPSGWDGVKALAMYRHAEKQLVVRFRGEKNPGKMAITASPQEPIILIAGVDRCVVRGLVLRNGYVGVEMDDTLGSVVEDCVIQAIDYGVMIKNGADRCTVRSNEISLDPYAGADPYGEGSWDNWLAMKVGGYYDRRAVTILETLGGHRIHDNWIHDHWDGISDVGNPPWDKREDPPIDNPNLRIHHNYFSVMADDAMETMGASVNGRWHDNVVERSRCGFRIKAPQMGPLYLYGNIFFDNKEDYRNWGQGTQLFPEAEVWVYHNTSTSDAAVTMNYSKDLPVTTPNYHYYNNLFWCKEAVMKHPALPEPDWRGNFNVYVRASLEHPRPWDPPGIPRFAEKFLREWQEGKELVQSNGIDLDGTWVADGFPGFRDAENRDVSLTENSVARGRGIPRSDLRDEPLPGFPATDGKRPDAGALQYGVSMPVVPRSADKANQPQAGLWPPKRQAHVAQQTE